MTHEELLEAAQEAIAALFSDDSVDNAQTKESLETLREDIDSRILTLEG